MHILRNAVDHGIESRDNREHANKPPSGRITLSFAREGEHILIRCQDDGAGLDYSAIKKVAIDRGLLAATSTPTQEDLTRLIFLAGFSTREATTQVSGRGIGMDAAYTQVLQLKGSMRVESTPQTGTVIEIRLPVTLITLHGIMVKAREQVIAISNRGIEQILHAEAGKLSGTAGQQFFQFEDASYPAHYLEDLLGLMRSETQSDAQKRPALLVKGDDDKMFVVLAEAILSTQDLVIKQLGQYVPLISGLEGATILGDGRIAPVVNLAGIVKTYIDNRFQPLIERGDITGIQSGSPLVMVVDDSHSARRSLAEFMQDVGYRVITARDGIEAIEVLATQSPDILLVDMEMPRMNGLELTSYVRANKAIRNTPIIMITSRATDKHKQEADRAGVNAYLVKPYSEEDVIDNVEAQLTRAYAFK
jgi:chemotaxis protein histidine kinase CheA/CheY-like chemotaxis protein